jgi:hypothetical protein
MLAEELPNASFVAADSILEWRVRPDRITGEVLEFLDGLWPATRRRTRAEGRMEA